MALLAHKNRHSPSAASKRRHNLKGKIPSQLPRKSPRLREIHNLRQPGIAPAGKQTNSSPKTTKTPQHLGQEQPQAEPQQRRLPKGKDKDKDKDRRRPKSSPKTPKAQKSALIQVQFPQILSASLQAKDRKRKRSQEAEDPPIRIPTKSLPKRSQTSLVSPVVENKVDPIDYWRKEGRWPREYFEQDSQVQADLQQDSGAAESEHDDAFHERLKRMNMTGHYLLARKKSSASLRQSNSESNLTPSDQQPREAKSAPYAKSSYATILATKGSYMGEFNLDIVDASKRLCRNLLEKKQTVPRDSLFRDDLFKKTFRKIQDKNEARVVQDITRLIVPSAESLATYGTTNLDCLVESVNEGWNSAIPVYGPRPQPDYSVGFGRSAFTEGQLKKLEPFVGDILFGSKYTSYFMATWYMYFPFLTCEVKCGAAALDIADRQNAHSMTLAVRGIVELFRLVKREKELHREILAFSISHDHDSVRIYGHYPIIEGNKTTFYRRPIHKFSFTALDGKEKWLTYKFTKNVYSTWMPTHLKRICSIIDKLPSDISFELSQQSELQFSEESGLAQELEGRHLLQPASADSISLRQDGSQSSPAISQDVTANTSLSQRTEQGPFKKPKKRHAAE
ncbi:MAG: hypothetical protein Q9225_001181 [Loekoesia sp. 1 TL-2023]